MQMETRARTPFFFQMTLVEEMKEITSDMRFKMPRGTNLVPISVFPQALPIPQRADSPPDTPEDGGTINYVDGEEEEAIFKCPWLSLIHIFPELCRAVRIPICRPERLLKEKSGQLRFA